MQNSKVKLITPFLMLLAGAIASIIMYLKKYDFYKMLWVLLIVLIVFYVIGDVARYLYASVQPRVLPSNEIDAMIAAMENSVIGKEVDQEEETDEEVVSESEGVEDEEMDMSEEDSMDDESVEEYTDENLDEM